MKESALIKTLAFFLFSILVYSVFVFANWNINPGHWSVWNRWIFLIIEIIALTKW
jgi:hypothetical protein